MNIKQIKTYAMVRLSEVKWFGPIEISLFIILLTAAVNIAAMCIKTDSRLLEILIVFAFELFILMPFNMGYKIYMLAVAAKESEISVGRIFDGFSYLLKLIPSALISVGLSTGVSYLTVILSKISLFAGILIGGVILLLLCSIWLNVNVCVLYDSRMGPFKCLAEAFKLLFISGGIFKYISLYLSFILWFIAIIFSMGTLSVFVMPYTEESAVVLYYELTKKGLVL